MVDDPLSSNMTASVPESTNGETGAKSAAVTGGILLRLFWADRLKETNKISAVNRVLDIYRGWLNENAELKILIQISLSKYNGFFPFIDMTQTADRKTKITGGQAPVSVNTYGIYLACHIRMAIFSEDDSTRASTS